MSYSFSDPELSRLVFTMMNKTYNSAWVRKSVSVVTEFPKK